MLSSANVPNGRPISIAPASISADSRRTSSTTSMNTNRSTAAAIRRTSAQGSASTIEAKYSASDSFSDGARSVSRKMPPAASAIASSETAT